MRINRISTLLIATLMVSLVGCSSNRFRNLLSRSDYQSLEELEALETSGDEDQTALVSQERVVDEDSDEAKSKSPTRRALFMLGSFLGGRGSDEEITSDPFIDSEGSEEADGSDETEIVDNRVDPIREDKAREFVEAAARSEDTAESLIREAAHDSDLNPFERNFVESMAGGGADTEARNDSGNPSAAINEQSFDQFLAGEAADARQAAEDKFNDQAHDFDDIIAGTAREAADAEMSHFDRLLGKATSSTEELSPSELFPGLDELIPQQQEEVVSTPFSEAASETAPSPFDDILEQPAPAIEPRQQPTLEIEPRRQPGAEPIKTAAVDHGSSDSVESDPWSAFRKKKKPVAPPEPPAAQTDNAFSWVNSRPAPIEETSPFEPAVFNPNPEPQITQTSAAIDIEPPPPEFTTPVFDEPEADGLIIPTEPTFELTETDVPETHEENPFAEAESIATEEVTADAETPVETAAGFPFSSRTLFLLLGCVIIGFLLFMPERKNRTNA